MFREKEPLIFSSVFINKAPIYTIFLAGSFSDKQVRAVQLYSTELTHYIHC